MAGYLKSLELQGFKSFGVKTRIEFADGITGIVGPNGCGKSNVVEAFKWVLGEQSAKSLRGDKMQDIIFNGTNYRSASGMAEAILTFDNEKNWLPLEFPEVSISRRIFRSGEGQYYINGARSRLKDNIELFLDTGVGRDSYAIFEQGKIDRLLSESAEERRTLFEDFAGISKFKFRKEEAERKLAQAQENLEKLQETLDRLEREIAALEIQARDAEAYKTLSAELRSFELKFEAARLENMRKEIARRSKEREALQNALAPLSEELTKIEDQALKSEEGTGEKESLFSQMNEKYHRLEKELAEALAQRNAALRRLEENKSRLAELEIRSKQDRERLEDGEEELSDKREAAFAAEKKEKAALEILNQAEERQRQLKNETEALEAALLKHSLDMGFNRPVNRGDGDILRRDITDLKGQVFVCEAELIRQEDIFKTKSAAAAKEKQNVLLLEEEYQNALKQSQEKSAAKALLLEKISEVEKEIRSLEARQKSLLDESKSYDKEILAALENSIESIRVFKASRPVLSAAVHDALTTLEELIKGGGVVPFSLFQNLKDALKNEASSYELLVDGLFGQDGAFARKIDLLDEGDALLKQLEQNRVQLDTLKKTAEIAVEEENSFISAKNRAENEYKNQDREYKKLQSEIEQAQMSGDRAKSDLFNAKQAVDKTEAKFTALEEAIHFYDEGHTVLRARYTAMHEELANARVSYTGVEAQAKALKADVRSLEMRLDDLNRSLNNVDSDRNNLQKTIESLNEEISELNGTEDEIKPELSRLQENMRKTAEEIQELHKAKRILETMRRDALEKYNKLRLRESEIEGALAERRENLLIAENNLKEQFPTEEISFDLSDEDTLEKLQESIKDTRGKLNKMGDVNMMAVEQYHIAQETFTNLSRQKIDIEAAAADTEALILETYTESAEKFMKSFEDIRKSFRGLFSELFDGGRADLILLNKEDPLNSGIDIMAEPPGQKFQSVSLLSGGQRAMVAIAVIFSMLKLKPTPFIILDEMDAPLDDENIERFKKLLTRFRGMGQFVIVSHSKSTLEVCDALFGVTMEELGCSKVLSVAFDETDALIFQ